MQAEIEVRFLDVDYNDLRKKLHAAGARQDHPMQFMKRVIIDYPDQRMQHHQNIWGFVRVRDEGGQVILTYKQVARNKTLDTHEIEVRVSSYDKTIELFEAIGLKVISEQHTRRETWHMHNCQISLDDWPWLLPMLEIEGQSEQVLQKVATLLGLDWSNHRVGNVVNIYREIYPGMTEEESIRDIEKLTFDEFPDWLRQRQTKMGIAQP